MNEFILKLDVLQYKNGEKKRISDPVILEHVLSISINTNPFFELVCSPDQPENLAAGFLFTQGVITDRTEIEGIVFDKKAFDVRINLCVKATNRLNTMNKQPGRKGSSGGLLSPESNISRNRPATDHLRISCDDVLRLIRLHHENSKLFKKTGAVHSCAICSSEEIIRFYEDVGRHNAFDKMAGDILMNNLSTTGKIVTASCRISLEILQKISMAGFSMVISNAAPTHTALIAAESAGITVIGFARDHRFNVYTHEDRVISSASKED